MNELSRNVEANNMKFALTTFHVKHSLPSQGRWLAEGQTERSFPVTPQSPPATAPLKGSHILNYRR